MIRGLLFATLIFISSTVFADDVISKYVSSSNVKACNPYASISSAPDFCQTFPPAAACNCTNHGMTPAVCDPNDLTNLYKMMMQTYHHNLADACNNPRAQQLTSTQECIDDWNCYWDGGTSTTGKCNATGIACTTKPRPV